MDSRGPYGKRVWKNTLVGKICKADRDSIIVPTQGIEERIGSELRRYDDYKIPEWTKERIQPLWEEFYEGMYEEELDNLEYIIWNPKVALIIIAHTSPSILYYTINGNPLTHFQHFTIRCNE
jgi:hypothetical protein